MWEVLEQSPRGSNYPRKISLLLATILLASFGYILALAPTASAAPDAEWDGQSIRYNDYSYEAVTETDDFPSEIASSPAVYQYIDTSKNPNIVHFIYFTNAEAQSEKEATYVRYTLNPPNDYSNKSGEKTISLTPVPEEEQATTEDTGALGSSCTIDGIGWMVCPLMNGIAEGMDFIFNRIRGFLVVQPMTSDVDNPVYRIWQVSRDLANMAFVIGFMIIIYNYIVGGGMSGYEIRKIIPRLVIAAILINVSYIICAVAVDISNIAGYGVNQLFEAVRDSTLTGSSGGEEINWASVTAWVLAGGTGAIAGSAILITSVGGAATGLWFLLAPFLLGAALVVMVTFLILAARQAIIVLAIAIAPLAFAAYILPNTEKWFERWRSLFFTMLVMFPAFAAVFGGAQLAGELIIRMAAANGSIELIILGLGVMVAPLAITPLLLKLGGGILGRIGGMINNREKGLVDRYRNYNKERLADHVARNNARNAELRSTNGFRGGVFGQHARRYASRAYAKNSYRSAQRKLNEEAAENSWHNQTGRWGHDSHGGDTTSGEHLSRRNQNGRGNLDFYKRDNQLRHDRDHAHHDEHWQETLNSDSTRRAMLTDTRLSQGRSKVIEAAHEAQDERTLQTALNTDAAYAGLKQMKIQTSVDSGVAELNKGVMDALGEQEFRQYVEGSRALTRVVKDTHHAKKQAELYENIVQKAAEKSWNDRVRNDGDTQTLYLRSSRYEDGATLAEKRLEEFSKEIRSRGEDTRGLIAGNEAIANTIRTTGVEITARDHAIENLKDEQSSYVLKALSTDSAIRSVAGGGTQLGATKVLAKAQSGITKLYLENVKAQTSVYSNGGYRVDEMLKAMQDDTYRLHDGTPVDTVAQHAAIQYVMEDIGNNWSVQKIIDWADTQGMEMVEGKNGQPDKYYDAVAFRQAKRTGGPLPAELTESEIGDRRDLLQMVVGGYRNGKNKVSYFTNTLQERMNRGLATARYNDDLGRDLSFSETAILTESKQQKYDPNRITSMDPDELAHMVQALREPGFRKQLSEDQRSAIVKKIVEAQTSDQTRHLIKGRERGLMNIVASYLELPPDSNPPITELQEIEQYFYEVERTDESGTFTVRVPRGTPGARRVKAPVEAPNVYDYTRQVDQVSGTGLKPPTPRP